MHKENKAAEDGNRERKHAAARILNYNHHHMRYTKLMNPDIPDKPFNRPLKINEIIWTEPKYKNGRIANTGYRCIPRWTQENTTDASQKSAARPVLTSHLFSLATIS